MSRVLHPHPMGCDDKGSDAQIYMNFGDDPTTGDSDCGTELWVVNEAVVGDLSLTETEDEEENTSRNPAKNVREFSESKVLIEISGEMQTDYDYEGSAFLNSMRSGGGFARDVMILSGPIDEPGKAGWRGKMRNYDRSANYPETGPGRQTFKLKPSACSNPGCWVRPVRISNAAALEDYDPADFEPYTQGVQSYVSAQLTAKTSQGTGEGMQGSKDERLIASYMRALQRAEGQEFVSLPASHLIHMLGLEETEPLVLALTEGTQSPYYRKKNKRLRKAKMIVDGYITTEPLPLIEQLNDRYPYLQIKPTDISNQAELQGSQNRLQGRNFNRSPQDISSRRGHSGVAKATSVR